MVLASLVLLDIVLRLRDLQAFYGDQGLLSRSDTFSQNWLSPVYCLFLAAGDTPGLLFLFGVWAVAATCMLVGYQTRLACVVTWYFVVSIQLRNPMVMDGGDDFLRLLLFWTPFLPLDARWSFAARKNPSWSRLPNSYRSIATVGVFLQFVVLYLFAAVLKNGADWMETRDALYYTLSIDQFSTGFAKSLLAYPDTLRSLTLLALLIEFLLPLLLILPLTVPFSRALFLTAAVSFHLAIASMLHLGIFMLIMIVSLVVFIPGAWWERFVPSEDVTDVEGVAPGGYSLSKPTKVFAGFILFYIVYVNVFSIRLSHKLHDWAHVVARYTYEHQHWHFFAPNPYKEDGFYGLLITLDDGEVVDILRKGPVDEDGKPHSVSAEFDNQRWRRWMQNLIQIKNSDTPAWRASTMNYFVRRWLESHPERKIRQAEFVFMQEISVPPGQTPKLEKIVLATRQ